MNPSRSENLEIGVSDSPKGARILTLSGPLTIRTLFEFQETSREEPSKSIIVVVVKVPYMDSAGLGSVISVYTSCQRTNRGFAIVGVSDRIRTLFEVTHVDGLLPCFASIDEADPVVAGASS